MFEEPEQPLPLREAVEFYQHTRGWKNRLVAGDSLLVMNSLLEKEGMAGKVQMVYLDPPYGIKYGSNFQPFVNKRDVKDGADQDLTQEPEMIQAFRDTWELGIHSYLTYLPDDGAYVFPSNSTGNTQDGVRPDETNAEDVKRRAPSGMLSRFPISDRFNGLCPSFPRSTKV